MRAAIVINRDSAIAIWDIYVPDTGPYWKKINVSSTVEGAIQYCKDNGWEYKIST